MNWEWVPYCVTEIRLIKITERTCRDDIPAEYPVYTMMVIEKELRPLENSDLEFVTADEIYYRYQYYYGIYVTSNIYDKLLDKIGTFNGRWLCDNESMWIMGDFTGYVGDGDVYEYGSGSR